MLLILFFLIIIFVAIITLKIRVNFEDIQISNINENGEKTKLKQNYNIKLEIYIFTCIKIMKFTINNEKIKKASKEIKVKFKYKDISKGMKGQGKTATEAFKKLNIKLRKLNLNIKIGTDGIVSTVSIFTLLSSLIPILCRNNYKNLKYKVTPIYNAGNVINLWTNGIIEVYLVHIIYALYILIVKGRKENGRGSTESKSKSSYREAYDYGNG